MKSLKLSNKKSDFLIIGAGLAGLFYALKVADNGSVIILAKEQLNDCNSAMAQGGVAVTLKEKGSLEEHIKDTLNAGAGLCHEDIVREAITHSSARINDLIDFGVNFDMQENSDLLSLTKEGGHSERRIVHVQDYTGQAIQTALIKKVKEHPNIEIFEDHMAIDLITSKKLNPFSIGNNQCRGAYVLNKKTSNVETILGKQTILATGGAGKVYLYTSNWSGATGDGIAMATRAGAKIANLEFMQFHPTCLFHPHARNFLVSEAIRGEGGELINSAGKAFMKEHHPMGSLAPRDLVARSIDNEIKTTGENNVFIDITHKSKDFLQSRFPVIFNKCQELGINISTDPIPVVPAAHYLCGGVLTNKNGETDIENLFAIGETACNGFHGANRLASNSLLDCTVFSHNAAKASIKNLKQFSDKIITSPPSWIHHKNKNSDEMIVITHMWEEIRHLMWNYVGIVRSNNRLKRAQSRLQNITNEIKEYYWNLEIHSDILELRNIASVASLTVECALRRKNSVGIHYNIDYPEVAQSQLKDTVIH